MLEVKPISFRPTDVLDRRLRDVARIQRRSLSQQIIWLLELALDDLERTPEAKLLPGTANDDPDERAPAGGEPGRPTDGN